MQIQDGQYVSPDSARNAFDRHVVNAACHLLMVGLWFESQARGIRAARTTPHPDSRQEGSAKPKQ
jgi:hypothetical protein